MTDDDTRTVELTYRVSARPETVWRFWTDAERLCDWWGRAAVLDPVSGGMFRTEMDNGLVMRGEYVELVPHERIVFTFGWESGGGAPEIAPGSSVVEVTLEPDGTDTVLTLRHTAIPAAWSAEHRTGWELVLPKLLSAVEAVAS